MNDQADTARTEARLRAALTAAADVMVIHDAPQRQQIKPARQRATRNWGRLAPLAAAAGVVVIAAGTVIGAHLASPGGTRANTAPGTTGTTAQTPRPEFYLTVTYPASGQNVLQFQVRRTDGGAVTGEKTIPAADVGWGGYLAAGAGNRTFYFAHYPCTASTATPRTTFDRITITNSGRISGFGPAGPPVQGMVTAFAVSPSGLQVAYNALPGGCTGEGFRSTAASSVSVEDLSTGAVRTWQDTTTPSAAASRLSWTPDGRSLIVDESPRAVNRKDLTVFALNTSSGGGSLPAHSTTLLQQKSNCSACVATALAGPDGSLIELASHASGQHARLLVVRVPTKAGSPRTVLYAGPSGAPANAADNEDLFSDSSGTWPLLWPGGGGLIPRNQALDPAGWISGGRLHPLPGIAQIFPQGVAW
jgi:hypothetical protein